MGVGGTGRLLFVSKAEGENRIVRMKPDGSGLTVEIPLSSLTDPAWSPDRTRIAFSGGLRRSRAPFDWDGVAAEYAAVPASMLAPKPASLSHVEAAALPMGGLSAWQGLFEHGRLRRGERVIVTGARGGVGHLAVQLARHAGADVVEDGPADLVFDTVGGSLPAAQRVVTCRRSLRPFSRVPKNVA